VITITIAVSVPVTAAITVTVAATIFTIALFSLLLTALTLFVADFALSIAFFLPFLPFFLSISPAFVSLGLPLKLGLFTLLLLLLGFLFSNPSLLLFNGSLLRFQLIPNAFALSFSCCCICCIFFVCFGTASFLRLGGFLPDGCLSNLSYTVLNGAHVNQLANNLFCFLINARSFQCAVNKDRCLSLIQSQELLRVPLDLLLCNLKNGLCDLGFVVLVKSAW
jgi:hypothetical protein